MAERFNVVIGDDGAPRAEKRGDPAALDREAAALAAVAGRPWAPALLAPRAGAAGDGAGAGRRRATSPPSGRPTRAGWGRCCARCTTRGAPPSAACGGGGCRRATSPRTARGGSATRRRRWRAPRTRGWPHRFAAEPVPPGDAFALLHGDLVAANVLWPPGGGPVLIDWEFHRMGDPAEDLAYLAEVNGAAGRRARRGARGPRHAGHRGAGGGVARAGRRGRRRVVPGAGDARRRGADAGAGAGARRGPVPG